MYLRFLPNTWIESLHNKNHLKTKHPGLVTQRSWQKIVSFGLSALGLSNALYNLYIYLASLSWNVGKIEFQDSITFLALRSICFMTTQTIGCFHGNPTTYVTWPLRVFRKHVESSSNLIPIFFSIEVNQNSLQMTRNCTSIVRYAFPLSFCVTWLEL